MTVSSGKKRIIGIALFFVLVAGISLLSFSYAKNTPARKAPVRCHRCKDKDINLVFKHKQIGFDGCFTCHKDLIGKKPAKKKNGKRK